MFPTSKFTTSRYPCVHDTIQTLKSWDFDKVSFFTGRFTFPLDSINRNFLKNLFTKAIKDNAFWYNINNLLDKSLLSTKFTGFYFTNDIIE